VPILDVLIKVPNVEIMDGGDCGRALPI